MEDIVDCKYVIKVVLKAAAWLKCWQWWGPKAEGMKSEKEEEFKEKETTVSVIFPRVFSSEHFSPSDQNMQ